MSDFIKTDIWKKYLSFSVSEEEINLLLNPESNESEKTIIKNRLKSKKFSLISQEEEEELELIYNSAMPSGAKLINCNISLPKGNGIINCLVDGEQRQIRF
jgi:hypothetical protein